jgi:predicted dehydrogenase
MEKVRIGIIGCGGIAHGKHLPALKRLPNVELTAFCDIEVDKAVRTAAEFGVPGAAFYSDYRELLESGSVDAVNICTPNSSHAQIAIDAMEAGFHVLTEKPMAKTAADARAMVEAAKRTGKLLTVGYQSRYRADSQYLKKIIEDGDLGEIYMAKAHAVRRRAVPTWGVFLDAEKQGGGPLIDIGTHALDLTLWLMNNYEVASVTGSVYRKLADRENAANAWGSWDPKVYTVEDSAFGFIKMKNGATVFLESSWALNARETAEAQCTLYGSEAGADMKGGLYINGEKHSKLYVNEVQLGGKGVAFYDATPDRPENTEMAVFVSAILNGTPLTILPEQACVVSEVLEAIYKSAETGKVIEF